MPLKFNINNVISLYEQDGGTTNFPDSLRQVLTYAQNDNNLTNINELAYLLATAKGESDYLLTRWEADYLCGEKGVPYDKVPCQKALNYYRSSDGKQNYYNKGVDKNGIPYFGRGLIQLTNKANYETYGKLAGLGTSLLENGDLALVPKNSYNIASAFLNKNTFKHVNNGDFTRARRSVNGGVKGVDKINREYDRWMYVFQQPNAKVKVVSSTKKKRTLNAILITTAIVFGVGAYLVYRINKKK